MPNEEKTREPILRFAWGLEGTLDSFKAGDLVLLIAAWLLSGLALALFLGGDPWSTADPGTDEPIAVLVYDSQAGGAPAAEHEEDWISGLRERCADHLVFLAIDLPGKGDGPRAAGASRRLIRCHPNRGGGVACASA